MIDVKDGKNFAAVVVGIMSGVDLRRTHIKGKTIKPTNATTVDFYNEHEDTLQVLMSFSRKITPIGVQLLTRNQLPALIYLLSYEGDSDVVIDFFRELMIGITINTESNIAHVLRNKLIANKLSSTKLQKKTIMQLVIKSFRLYMKGKNRRYISLTVGENIKPVDMDINIEPDINLTRMQELRGY